MLWTAAAGYAAGRWPAGGSLSGLVLGVIAAVLFLFEFALLAKKTRRFRTVRWLGSAQVWMKAHIWLGLLTVPLVILHSGGRLGSMLTTLLVVMFAVVIGSGLWGLWLQNFLPRLLLESSPAETVYSQIDRVGEQYAHEARRLVYLACGGGGAAVESVTSAAPNPGFAPLDDKGRPIRGAPRGAGVQYQPAARPATNDSRVQSSPVIEQALASEIEPYLAAGKLDRSLLGTSERNRWYFDDLRLRVAPEHRELVGQLEELCERRRQLNVQQRMHFWLHNWLWLHLPLSIGLIVLLVGHVIFALQFS